MHLWVRSTHRENRPMARKMRTNQREPEHQTEEMRFRKCEEIIKSA